ncbi:MAG: NAD kinase [Lactobacillus sp.]|jgi:NAD+ kinase|nr:NAD kinase [Lactobacillus sp.]MCH3906613.1 NAD kinase [Lactobacillus sp.]MCH3989751.1 NAD kinase [Lactobacillus sp.]MCH4068083.1 NAD kinase [Lactobacillus sp.]MCI1303961.1 NAD kinase [Lactobacillus sp.]
MRVALVYNHQPQTLAVAQKLEHELLASGIKINADQPNVVISIGGDGTLLSAFHRYLPLIDDVRFIGVHTGHLGFYTDWRDFELAELVKALKQRQPETVSYPLLEVRVKEDHRVRYYTALNEASIKGGYKTLEAEVDIKGQFFENFRGDGLCVSTPTGSTAYSKSLGGAVIHPTLKALQMTEIASLNNRLFRTLSAPVVIPPDQWITLKPKARPDLLLVVDGHRVRHRQISELDFSISKHMIHFDRFKYTHFWNRVRDSFLGQDS